MFVILPFHRELGITFCDKWNEVVVADTLKHEERRGGVPTIYHKVRTPWRNGIGITGLKPDFLLRLPQEEPDTSFEHIKRVLDIVMVVPRYLLCRRNLNFVDTEPGSVDVILPALDLIEITRIFHRFHRFLYLALSPNASGSRPAHLIVGWPHVHTLPDKLEFRPS